MTLYRSTAWQQAQDRALTRRCLSGIGTLLLSTVLICAGALLVSESLRELMWS